MKLFCSFFKNAYILKYKLNIKTSWYKTVIMEVNWFGLVPIYLNRLNSVDLSPFFCPQRTSPDCDPFFFFFSDLEH